MGSEAAFLATAAGQDAGRSERDGHLRLMYVAMTRAREKLVFAIRSSTRGGDASAGLACVPEFSRFVPDTAQPGETELPELGTSLIVRALEAAEAEVHAPEASPLWWQPLAHEGSPAPERVRSPSGVKPDPADRPSLEVEPLAGPRAFPAGAGEAVGDDEHADYGDALHAYLATLPATAGLDRDVQLEVAKGCLAAHEVEVLATPEQLVAAGERFIAWCEQAHPGATLLTEVPVTGPRADGGLWHGTMDALLERPDGAFVIVDHKSTPVGTEGGQRAVARRYAGQLRAYAEALEGLGARVAEAWIHLPVGGACVRVGLGAGEVEPVAARVLAGVG